MSTVLPDGCIVKAMADMGSVLTKVHFTEHFRLLNTASLTGLHEVLLIPAGDSTVSEVKRCLRDLFFRHLPAGWGSLFLWAQPIFPVTGIGVYLCITKDAVWGEDSQALRAVVADYLSRHSY